MVELAHCAANHLRDLGMAVTENGAHLTGAEVEKPPPVGIPHEAALSAFRDEWCEFAAVTNQMCASLIPKHRVGIAPLGLSDVLHRHSRAGHAFVIASLAVGIQLCLGASAMRWPPSLRSSHVEDY